MSTTPGPGPVWLALRSIAWVVLLPGLVAGFVPWRYFGLAHQRVTPADPLHLVGLGAMALGVALLGVCAWHFAHSGRGTLAPVDAPRLLVVHGPYRYLRNPMYVAVTLILLGEVLLTRSLALLAYWALWFGLVNLFVIGYEEPVLRRRFGEPYQEYRRSVGRWIPRRRAGGASSRTSAGE